MHAGSSEFVLEMLNISKSFPGVKALDNVSLSVRPGEVHALLGENGAGKSTLMKILSGAYVRDAGRILLNGAEAEISNPHQALLSGIVTIYQETSFAPDLNVAENIFMGRLPTRLGFWFDERTLQQDAQKLLDRLGASFKASSLLKVLSPAQRQMAEIARAISVSAKVIVLDEPTASLTGREVETLISVIRELRSEGVAIIYITHRLEEVFSVADRATVVRDGHWVATENVSDTTVDRIVGQMVGREVEGLCRKERPTTGKPVLTVEAISGAAFRDVSFDIRESEIVGLFGLVGSGRTDVARAIFGADRISGGSVSLDGQRLKLRAPEDAIRAGIALAPEDRKLQGLILGMPVRANISLPTLRQVAALIFLRFGLEQKLAQDYKASLDIRAPSVETVAKSLSGGNQQKVVIAKWLAAKPRILILDEPTRGIDVAGKSEVHRLISDLARQGVGILLISSEMPEVMGISDRILVMHEGRLVGEQSHDEVTEEKLMMMATGQCAEVATPRNGVPS